MSRFVNAACALLVAVPATALAQTRVMQGRAEGLPVGIAVPSGGAAAAEEPTALAVNPAGTGFVDGLTLQYFHEGRGGTGQAGDGAWLATPFGPLVSTLSMQWIRPPEGGGARFRKTTFGLAIARAQTFSIGAAGNWHASPDRDLDQLWSLDVGATFRPWRHLSVAAAVLGMNGSAGRRLPVQYDLGIATRFWRDRVTLSTDLLADDRTTNDFAVTAAAVGMSAEIVQGIAVQGQLQFPVRSGLAGPSGSTYGTLALTWNAPHAGVTAARGSGDGADATWLLGARLSAQRYLAAAHPVAPLVDLSKALSRSRSLFGSGDRNLFAALLRRIGEIRDDPSAPAVAVTIDDLPVGQGRIEELRRLLLDVTKRKPVVAYLTGGGMKEYYLATAATVVLAPPSADLFPAGLASSAIFVRDALAKIGVAFDVVAIGRYKNAPDALVRQDMSPEQREVTMSILDDLFARQVRAIAGARGLAEERIRELVDTGVFTSEQAVSAKLIDGVAWPDELEAAVSQRVGRPTRLSAGRDRSELRGAQRWGPRPAVAVVRVEGMIAQGKSRSDPLGTFAIAGAETIASLLKLAAADRDVVAIVLRVESPGGDGLASDLLWREVLQARRLGKPVVASMGDQAASGGYLVAAGADAIVAEPSTLTGSIGVFAVKPDLSGLLAKIGAHQVTTTRGQHADLQSVTRRWTDDERALVERQVSAFYDTFVARVAAGRKMTTDAVDRVARGRVWTGAQALERGLVDALGSLEDAVRLAKEKAGYAGDVEVKPFEPARPVLEELLAGLGNAEQPPLVAALGRVPGLGAAAALFDIGPVVALPPGWLGATHPATSSP